MYNLISSFTFQSDKLAMVLRAVAPQAQVKLETTWNEEDDLLVEVKGAQEIQGPLTVCPTFQIFYLYPK